MKKKILVVSTSLAIGGVERSLLSLLHALDPEEYLVDLMLTECDGALQHLIPTHVRVVYFPCRWVLIRKGKVFQSLLEAIGFNLNALKLLFYLAKGIFSNNLGKARQQFYQSVMHTLPRIPGHYDAAIDYSGGYKAFILNKTDANRKISWVHGDYRVFPRERSIDADDYRRLDTIVAVSETCRDIFVTAFPMTRDKCLVMPNITLKSSIVALSHQEVDFDSDYQGIRIVDVTRLDPDKGLDMAIEACAQLVAWGYDVKWYLVGEGPEKERLTRLIAGHGLSERFILLGSKENPYPYIQRADMIVHCSRFEGKSVAIDEAKLLAKPIILTDYPTAKDQIESEVNGVICGMSSNEISNAVKRMIDNVSMRRAFQEVLETFNIDVEVSLNVFREMLS